MKQIANDRVDLQDSLDWQICDQVPYRIRYSIEHDLEDPLWMELIGDLAQRTREGIYDSEQTTFSHGSA